MNDWELEKRFEFREVRPEEAPLTAEIEQICFPPNEACTLEFMKDRIAAAPEMFLVAEDREKGRIVGFLNGIATSEDTLRDEFFKNGSLHNPEGKNVMLLGLAVLPEYRRQGLASELMRYYKERERARGRERLVLTCLDSRVCMYEKMGFKNLGDSESEWGGFSWNEMEYRL